MGSARSADYGAELSQLAATYRAARAPSPDLEALLERGDDGPALYVASGGAFAVAQFAADLHHFCTGHIAQAITPLEFCSTRSHGDTAVVMFSASGRHPDATMAMKSANAGLYRVIGLVTLRSRAQLPPGLRGERVQVVTVPSALERDGFLATNSVLAMMTALASARVGHKSLPKSLPMLGWDAPLIQGEQCLALYPSRHAAVGCDLEARLHETGLLPVQLADYRNFAHGRHAGLARNLGSTTVVAFKSPEQRELADRTLALLPKTTKRITIDTALTWPASALDLIVGSMRLIEPKARAAKVNPSRPGVAPFGRRLYHLTVRPNPDRPSLVLARKLQSMGRPGLDPTIRAAVKNGLDGWHEAIAGARFTGVVLDYDGTCCTTEGRFELPPEEIRLQLARLLKLGICIGFASGRGASLHRDLRKWVPREQWDRIVLGLYNGALLLDLSADVGDQSQCEGVLAAASKRLRAAAFAPLITLEQHTHQVEARLSSSRAWTGPALAVAAREVFEREPPLPVKVVASAHSLDVVAIETTKRRVLDAVRSRCDGDVLAIGDQGQVGGNDFELLSASQTTLSVDRCSSDPTRCWNLDDEGHRGPVVLHSYLRALHGRRDSVRFRWSKR